MAVSEVDSLPKKPGTSFLTLFTFGFGSRQMGMIG